MAILHLLDLDFVKQGTNIVLIGNPGTGKTFLSKIFGWKACQANLRVLFTPAMQMLNQLVASQADHSLVRKRKIYTDPTLLVCDELGYLSLDQQTSNLFYQVISTRHAERRSTVITTNKWVDIPDAKYPDQLTSNQIKVALDSELLVKGLTRTEDDKADLYIAYQIAINEEKQWYATGYGGRYRTMGGMGTATSSTIRIGTLAVDMYDVAEKKQVWHGDATKTLDPSKDPQKNQEKLRKVAKKLLKDYPPKAKK